MGKEVTVDSDDLGVVLTATAVVKQVEQVLQAHKSDPFATRDGQAISVAHDRLAKQWRGALRGESNPGWNEELTDSAATLLRKLDSQMFFRADPANIKDRKPFILIDNNWVKPSGGPVGLMELRGKGMVEIGSLFEVVFWAEGGGKEHDRIDKAQFCLRITARGLNELNRQKQDKASA